VASVDPEIAGEPLGRLHDDGADRPRPDRAPGRDGDPASRHVIHVLGTAQDGGLPQLGAQTPADSLARRTPAHRRTAASLCAVAGDGRALLVDVTPDVKEQERRLLADPVYAARRLAGERGKTPAATAPQPFDAILLTHAHVGHYGGLVHLGHECAATRGIPCHVTARMAAFLRQNAPWEQLVRRGHLELHVLGAATGDAAPAGVAEHRAATLAPWPGLEVRVFTVPHRADYTDTLGVSINDTVLYVPDIDAWDAWDGARDAIASHPICLLDGTFHDERELPSRDRAEIPHPTVVETMRRFADLAATQRIVFTHLNHTNPLCDPGSPEARRVADAGFEVAHEMMRFEL
jgi:pyrroloquinoline quinone biosynthesis protein B